MADSLQFNVGADTSGFQSGIGGMLGALAGLVAAVVSAQAVIEAFGKAIDLGGRLHDLSTRTGETAGNLALLERAFENTSVGADKLGPSIARMQDSIIAAKDGTEKSEEAFRKLGLTWDDLINKSPLEQLQMIAHGMTGVGNESQRSAIAIDIFGRAGAELLPLLMNFGDELETAKNQLGSLPEQLNKTAASVDGLGDNLAAIRSKTTELAYGFLSEVVPALTAFTDKLAGVDAAQIGANLADILVGAFVAPQQAVKLLGDTLILGAMNYGNTMLSTLDYVSRLLDATFGGVGIDLVGTLQTAGMIFIETIDKVFNNLTVALNLFGPLGSTIAGALNSGMDTAKQSIAGMSSSVMDFTGKLGASFRDAYEKTQFIYKDFLGAGEQTSKIQSGFASLQQSARDAMNEFNKPSIFNPTGGSIAEFGAGAIFGTDEYGELPELYSETSAKIDMMSTSAVTFANTVTKTAAQIAAEVNKALGLIASANPNQAIGRSQQASQAQALDQQLQQMAAMGQTGTPEYNQTLAQYRSAMMNAFDIPLNAMEKETAHQQALEEYFKDPSQSLSALEKQFEDAMIDKKMEDSGLKDLFEEQDKKTQEEADKKAPAKEDDQKKTPQSILQELLKLMEKIEPRVPVANLA